MAARPLDRGVEFLLARQGADGLWRDFLTPAGEASEWPTAVVAAALRQAGGDAGALRRAADALVARQNDDGGWGYNEDVPSDADSTACAVLFLAPTAGRESACRRAARCLVGHQRDGGGIATYRDPREIRAFMGVGRWMRFDGWCSPHTEVTATAGRALAALAPEGDAEAAAAAAWGFVRSRQSREGSWSSYWWASPHYATLQACGLALAAGDGQAVHRAAGWALRLQNEDGGWSAPGTDTSAFATALALDVLVKGRAPREALDRAAARLAALQDDDGGWASHPIMRIPLPGDANPDRRRRLRVGGRGIVVRDQHRTFTSAACVAALAHSRAALDPIDTLPRRY